MIRPDPGESMKQMPTPAAIVTAVCLSDDGASLRLLDQTLLPEEERYLRLGTVEEVAEAISTLRVRGAPAIGIAAALALAVATRNRFEAYSREPGLKELEKTFLEESELLRGTRPTAVNLSWAVDRMRRAFSGAAQGGPGAAVDALVREAEAIANEDREMCRLIGEHGAALIPGEGAGVLTHCNAGALATGGIGTALAPVYTAHSRGVPIRLFADETRPLLQGARLTAWEAGRAGVRTTVVTDSAAAALMRSGAINLVIVGADRVAANGDVANKIGTYGVAVLARHHGIPFYVALPRSTFDLETAEGRDIPIEERDSSEIAGSGERTLVPPGAGIWNPAFDLTPAHLVTAFITDAGVLRPPFGPAIAGLFHSGSASGGFGAEGRKEGS